LQGRERAHETKNQRSPLGSIAWAGHAQKKLAESLRVQPKHPENP